MKSHPAQKHLGNDISYLNVKKRLEGICFEVYVIAGSKREEIRGARGDPPRFCVKLRARPVEGKANQALLKFFSKKLQVAKSQLELLKGNTSRIKVIFWRQGNVEQLRKVFQDQVQVF